LMTDFLKVSTRQNGEPELLLHSLITQIYISQETYC